MKVEDLELFMRYALPCIDTKVKRGEISGEEARKVLEEFVRKRKIPKDFEKRFYTAFQVCSFLAKRKGKDKIDSEIIREYFWWIHPSVVRGIYKIRKDFNPVECLVYPGIVLEVFGNLARVRTPIGGKEYRKDFVESLRKKDKVVVHRGYVVERISEENFEKLWKFYEKVNVLVGIE